MLEQFRQYEIKNTREIFARENQFTLDCPAAPRPSHYTNDMPFCLPTSDHTNTASADGYFGRSHGD